MKAPQRPPSEVQQVKRAHQDTPGQRSSGSSSRGLHRSQNTLPAPQTGRSLSLPRRACAQPRSRRWAVSKHTGLPSCRLWRCLSGPPGSGPEQQQNPPLLPLPTPRRPLVDLRGKSAGEPPEASPRRWSCALASSAPGLGLRAAPLQPRSPAPASGFQARPQPPPELPARRRPLRSCVLQAGAERRLRGCGALAPCSLRSARGGKMRGGSRADAPFILPHPRPASPQPIGSRRA